MSLEEILKYQHPAVVKRFSREHPKYADRANEIFTDLMRFFWISKRHELDRELNPSNPAINFTFIMDDEMRPIDQMWHVFLLYTQDYMDFCDRYFGEYLHHLPDIVPTLENTTFDAAENLEKFLAYVYDQAGEETLNRWFPSAVSA